MSRTKNSVKSQPPSTCHVCNRPCASWCKVQEHYFYADHDPICSEGMRSIFKRMEAFFLLTFVYPPDESIVQ